MSNLSKLVTTLMVAGMVAAAFFFSSPSARAAGDTVNGQAQLTGTLTINSTTDLNITGALSGVATSFSSSFTATVSDTTGNTTGWNLNAVMTTFDATGRASLEPAKITDASKSDVSGFAATTNTVSSYGTGLQLDPTISTTIFGSANAAGVVQKTLITFTAAVDVPANTPPGTYSSILTLTLAPAV